MTVTIFDGLDQVGGIATAIIISILGIFVCMHLSTKVPVRGVAVAMLWSVIANALVFLSQVVLFGLLLQNDELTWHLLGTEAARFLTGEAETAISYVPGKEGYIWLLGLFYAISGPTPVVPIIFNMILHALLVLTISSTVHRIATGAHLAPLQVQRAVLSAARLTALSPIFLWWTPNVLRETITLFCVALAMSLLVDSIQKRRLSSYFLSIIPLVFLYLIRGSLGITVSLAMMVAGLFILTGTSRFRLMARVSLLAFAILAVTVVVPVILEFLGMSEERILIRTSELSDIASSGFPGLSSTHSVQDVITITLPRVLAGPFLWELSSSPVMLLALVELLWWLLVVYKTLKVLLALRRGHLKSIAWVAPIVLISALLILVGLTLVVGNYGILARFRPIASVCLLPLAAFAPLVADRESRSCRGSKDIIPVVSANLRNRDQ